VQVEHPVEALELVVAHLALQNAGLLGQLGLRERLRLVHRLVDQLGVLGVLRVAFPRGALAARGARARAGARAGAGAGLGTHAGARGRVHKVRVDLGCAHEELEPRRCRLLRLAAASHGLFQLAQLGHAALVVLALLLRLLALQGLLRREPPRLGAGALAVRRVLGRGRRAGALQQRELVIALRRGGREGR